MSKNFCYTVAYPGEDNVLYSGLDRDAAIAAFAATPSTNDPDVTVRRITRFPYRGRWMVGGFDDSAEAWAVLIAAFQRRVQQRETVR